nr:MAG TPA: hypothetical protein [Caudoviricetes sp.]
MLPFHPYYDFSFPCISKTTGKSTFGFLPYALIVTDPAATAPGTKAEATYAKACASVTEEAGLMSTLLFAKILEFEIL